ncbi:CPBP family glutamic-type intramembrane protease [Aquimarina sp. 2201CG14-23]|uniref:CPBP family glutamic-type intramembrane protease n=1 Tax=Aquimarina mycalae TaxID=3040073 RepID=UPI00247829B6|nr:CPBP family glutamic-type intramembrane protease [Aquimarina sp. 2201CG14-23]MDH7444012.1 CPBP family glutamic-type intramembrane protease [Aquimarina sp. 2201CG14-23]
MDLKKYSQDGLFEILKDNKLKAFVSVIIYAPIIEELMFRTLIKPTKKELLLFLSIWTTFTINLFITLEQEWYYRYFIFLGFTLGIFFIYKRVISKKYLEKIKYFLNDHQLITLQITSIIFGFVHIFNYVDSFRIDSVLFLLIVPRIISGHMFGKLKIKNGHIIWPMLLHALNNGVVFLIVSSRL